MFFYIVVLSTYLPTYRYVCVCLSPSPWKRHGIATRPSPQELKAWCRWPSPSLFGRRDASGSPPRSVWKKRGDHPPLPFRKDKENWGAHPFSCSPKERMGVPSTYPLRQNRSKCLLHLSLHTHIFLHIQREGGGMGGCHPNPPYLEIRRRESSPWKKRTEHSNI